MNSLKRQVMVAMIAVFVSLGGQAGVMAQTEDETNNILIYRKAGVGVVNITSAVLERDFFSRPIPKEGADQVPLLIPRAIY